MLFRSEVRATDPAAPARLQKTDITELDALAGSIETLSDEVLRAGGKFTQILEMASAVSYTHLDVYKRQTRRRPGQS